MNKKYIYDESVRKEAVRRYVEGESMRDICGDIGCNNTTGYMWLKEFGIPNRRQKQAKGKIACFKCGHTGHYPQALFCCMCGATLKSAAELIVEELEYVLDMAQFFPEGKRNRIVIGVNKAIAYIEEAEKEKKEREEREVPN